MKPLDNFEAAHMTPQQLVAECWERDHTYQDYLTQCELLKHEPLSKETFNRLYEEHDTNMAQSIARRAGNSETEQKFFRTL